MSDIHLNEARELIEALCEENLSPKQEVRLQDLLEQSEDAQWLYIEYLNLHANLGWDSSKLAAVFGESELTAEQPLQFEESSHLVPLSVRPRIFGFIGRRFNSFGKPAFWSVLAASVLFACYLTAITWNMWGREQPERREMATHESDVPTKPAVAKISDAGGAVWANESSAKWNEPAVTANEPLKIESGVVRLTLKQGTMLTVQAPAEWSVTGDNQARLKRGTMFAHVPPKATGFTLNTPSAQIVDLGTEFSTVVTESGETKLHVVKGKVELAQNTALEKPQRLVAGESAKVSKTADGTTVVESIPFDVEEATVKAPAKPFDRWLAASQKLRTDPSLVAYYDFQAKGSKLKNVVADKLHGEIITSRAAPPWTDGRWHGKHALAFGQDFANVSIPNDPTLLPKGDWTFAVWFRVDARPTASFALILGKSAASNRTYTLWLKSTGELLMSVRPLSGGGHYGAVAKPFANSQWNFVVGVFDAGKMRLYFNGAESCDAAPMTNGVAVDDQPLMLGRVHSADPQPFTGVIDELALFARALSAEEIVEMYRTGKPER